MRYGQSARAPALAKMSQAFRSLVLSISWSRGRIRGAYAMMLRRSALTVFVFFTSVSIALACGTERWAVKIGTDRDADKINMTAEDTTIAELS